MFDHAIRKFDRPVAPARSENLAVKPPKLVVVTSSDLDNGLPRAIAFEELSKLAVPRQNLLVGHLDALLHGDPEKCAVAAKYVQPYLSIAQVAVLCGRSERQLRRYIEFQKFNADVADAKDRLRLRSYMAAELED